MDNSQHHYSSKPLAHLKNTTSTPPPTSSNITAWVDQLPTPPQASAFSVDALILYAAKYRCQAYIPAASSKPLAPTSGNPRRPQPDRDPKAPTANKSLKRRARSPPPQTQPSKRTAVAASERTRVQRRSARIASLINKVRSDTPAALRVFTNHLQDDSNEGQKSTWWWCRRPSAGSCGRGRGGERRSLSDAFNGDQGEDWNAPKNAKSSQWQRIRQRSVSALYHTIGPVRLAWKASSEVAFQVDLKISQFVTIQIRFRGFFVQSHHQERTACTDVAFCYIYCHQTYQRRLCPTSSDRILDEIHDVRDLRG